MTNEELAMAVQVGDNSLMDQLWQQCYGFIRQQAMRWARAWECRPDFDVDDLTQAGYIALCEAVRSFQQERGGFLSFLSFYLKTEFSKVSGCRTDAQMKEPLNAAVSLDAPFYTKKGEEATLEEVIEIVDPGFEAVEENIFNQQLASILDQAMSELPEKQRRVIELYYLHRLTYIQIAEILHCSTSYIGQLNKAGLKSLKNGKHVPILSEVLYGNRNYYKHTGLGSWKQSGMSSPEWELLRKEYKMRGRNLIYCVDELGLTLEQARRVFPA